nr:DNA-binding protein [Paenibacillus massiliensis]
MEQYTPNQLPPLMTKTQLMELLDIGTTKAAELLNREDFPVIREFGHPRVPTRLFLEWVESHTEWISANAGDGWNRGRGA